MSMSTGRLHFSVSCLEGVESAPLPNIRLKGCLYLIQKELNFSKHFNELLCGVKQFGVFTFSFVMKEKRESTVNDGYVHQESTGKAIAMPSSYSLCNIHRIACLFLLHSCNEPRVSLVSTPPAISLY